MLRRHAGEFIACVRLTGGSETSQYPQEEKETSISQVVASERETAETELHVKVCMRCALGVVGLDLIGMQASRGVTNQHSSRMVWESQPETVKVQ
jgi:hypothetical protein